MPILSYFFPQEGHSLLKAGPLKVLLKIWGHLGLGLEGLSKKEDIWSQGPRRQGDGHKGINRQENSPSSLLLSLFPGLSLPKSGPPALRNPKSLFDSRFIHYILTR